MARALLDAGDAASRACAPALQRRAFVDEDGVHDEVVAVRTEYAKGGNWSHTAAATKHQCPDCKASMEFYEKDGKLMVKCSKCAPAGMACDKCLPPKKG